ncbi:ester cyclase [Alphaproteobacteria bacterium]|nr:ester cyclase [Alphaproteobacteria bacterium]
MTDRHAAIKAALTPFREVLYNASASGLKSACKVLFDTDVICRYAHPIGEGQGTEFLLNTVFFPLLDALPDLERRDYLIVAGDDEEGQTWAGCAGSYVGSFMSPWYDIPPSGQFVHMRFHEFYRFEDNKVCEVQVLWDIPELMLQAGAWPMGPALGREWHVPGPAPQDGLSLPPRNEVECNATRRHVLEMLKYLQYHPLQGDASVMQMDKFWHPKMNWYGPAGIGTSRGIDEFRDRHQKPFLAAMPDRGTHHEKTKPYFFADGQYAAVTGWPTMAQTHSGGGWLGIAPTDKFITVKSLDFWRLENGLIRENWVLVDLLDVWHQLGVDVLQRMGEMIYKPLRPQR